MLALETPKTHIGDTSDHPTSWSADAIKFWHCSEYPPSLHGSNKIAEVWPDSKLLIWDTTAVCEWTTKLLSLPLLLPQRYSIQLPQPISSIWTWVNWELWSFALGVSLKQVYLTYTYILGHCKALKRVTLNIEWHVNVSHIHIQTNGNNADVWHLISIPLKCSRLILR